MPLSPGDQLYTGSPGNLEIQIGARAFVRGWANTHLWGLFLMFYLLNWFW